MGNLSRADAYVINVNHHSFNEYVQVLSGARNSWEIEDILFRPGRAGAEREASEILFRSAMDTADDKRLVEARRAFGRYTPSNSIHAAVRLKHLRRIGVDVGQEIQFVRNGVREFTTVITAIEPFERRGERLSRGEIRFGFRLHFAEGRKG